MEEVAAKEGFLELRESVALRWGEKASSMYVVTKLVSPYDILVNGHWVKPTAN